MRRLLQTIAVTSACIILLISFPSCYPGMYHRGMMGWNGYGMGWFMVVMGLFWIAVIVGIVLLVVWMMRSRNRPKIMGEDSALRILKERYARGEISKEEFEEKKRDLGA